MSEALASMLAVVLVNATPVIAPALGVFVGCAMYPLVCAAATIYVVLILMEIARTCVD